jgi:hypothetical protein
MAQHCDQWLKPMAGGNRVSTPQEILIHLDRYESHRMSHRRLDARLKATDIRLQHWASWAKPKYRELGWPVRSVTEKANEGGILAYDTARPSPEWPGEVVEVETNVCAFPIRHLAALMAHYFHLALLAEERTERFAAMVRYLARTRPHQRRELAGKMGESAFQHDLDRARWVLRAKLKLDLLE